MQSKYHMIEKRSKRDLNDSPKAYETLALLTIWLTTMFVLGMHAACSSANARESIPQIELRYNVLESHSEDLMCTSPQGPFPDHLGLLMSEVPTPEESEIVSRQINLCRRDVETVADPYLVLAVLRLEDQLGVPPEARGILASVWCIEASMKMEGRNGGPIRGDYHHGVARAHGPAQLWAWHRNWCGLTEGGADDLVASLTCYWQRAVDRREKRALDCEHSWRVGEALAANGPRYKRQGCKAKSVHWEEMESWLASGDENFIR